MADDMSDYIVEIRVKNGPMKRAMRNAGFASASALARAAGVSPSAVGVYLSLKKAPLRDDGKIRNDVVKISDALGIMPEEMFPDRHMAEPLRKSRTEVEMTFAEICQLSSHCETPEDVAIEHDKAVQLDRTLATLPPRVERVLRLRFGIGCEPKTLDEVAAEMNVSRERIRQIEGKGLTRLRNPVRSKVLAQC